jgi:ABC transporter, substrate-binding protein
LAFMKANEEEALKFTAEETGLSIEAVKSMYPQYDFSPKITAEDIKALEATQEFMLESKMIEQKVDIKSLLID